MTIEAPKQIPKSMLQGYSMNDTIPIKYAYRNDCGQESQGEYNDNYTAEKLDLFMNIIKAGGVGGYGMTDIWMYQALSSIEHDGLGRYGDPLDPDGDLRAMKEAKQFLKKDGIMFLSIPAGYDTVFFNVHRVYGEKRLPLLLKEWDKLDAFGVNQYTLKNNINNETSSEYQPVFVLKNS